jgi:hypothetical protein
MKRKVYTTARERKIDQIIGFVACPLLNVPLLAANWLMPLAGDALHVPTQAAQVFQVCASLLPWIVNGLVLVLAFLFRPHIGIGYMAAIGMTVCALAIMGILFLTACFGIIGALALKSVQSPLAVPLAWLVTMGLPLGALLLFVMGTLAIVIWWVRHK